MNDTQKKIIDAVIKKANRVCPGSLALIGIYGSVCTGDLHSKSDLDLLILINDDAGWQLAEGFILDNEQIGYDIYCTNWEMLEHEAYCHQAHISKLMDSQIVYVADDSAMERLNQLRAGAQAILNSDKRFECVDSLLLQAKQAYADAMAAEAMEDIRSYAALFITLTLDAVILQNGRYFKRGVKRTFDELAGLSLPENLEKNVFDIISSHTPDELKRRLTHMLQSAVAFAKRDDSAKKNPPARESLAGTYEEMFSNWRNKMTEAAQRGDVFSSFMNLASLQFMIYEVAESVAIAPFSVMGDFTPGDLHHNAQVFDDALKRYLLEYEKIGLEIKCFSDVDAFAASYDAE